VNSSISTLSLGAPLSKAKGKVMLVFVEIADIGLAS